METIREESGGSISQTTLSDVSDYNGNTCADKTEEYIGRKRIRLHEDEETKDESLLDDSTRSQGNNTDIDISKMCCAEQPIESTRMSNESSNISSINQTYLDRSCFKSIILDETKSTQVSIISRLVNLILSVHFDFKKVNFDGVNTSKSNSDEETIMRAVCCMKTVKDLTSQLCSVHEAVGLSDLKLLSHAFNEEVNDAWAYVKTVATQTKSSDTSTFQERILRLLELVGALSLAAVDHINKGEDKLYIDERYEGELSIYFLKHQNRFLTTMLDEASSTVAKGIEEMKHYQLSSSHEMSEDLVDGVMNVLTSMATLFQQCEHLSLVYLRSIEQCSGQYFADECYHLRNMLTDIIDYNENIALIVEKSKLVAKNCDALEQFLDVPVILADITKCICNSASEILAAITSKKVLDDVIIDALYESLEKFIFAGKTVRVGVSMLVQEVEKDLNVADDCSIIQLVQADTSFGKRGSLCPMNTSQISIDSLPSNVKSKFQDRRSSVRCEQYVSRYMDLSSISEK